MQIRNTEAFDYQTCLQLPSRGFNFVFWQVTHTPSDVITVFEGVRKQPLWARNHLLCTYQAVRWWLRPRQIILSLPLPKSLCWPIDEKKARNAGPGQFIFWELGGPCETWGEGLQVSSWLGFPHLFYFRARIFTDVIKKKILGKKY